MFSFSHISVHSILPIIQQISLFYYIIWTNSTILQFLYFSEELKGISGEYDKILRELMAIIKEPGIARPFNKIIHQHHLP